MLNSNQIRQGTLDLRLQGNDGILEGGIIQASGRPEDSDSGSGDSEDYVEEKFGEQKFRVLSEMRILAKIKVVILDFCRVCLFFSEIWREIGF